MNLANRWKFAVGLWHHTTVTVSAPCYSLAVDRAREAMDKRYERQDKEPPVAWDLALVEAWHHTGRRS